MRFKDLSPNMHTLFQNPKTYFPPCHDPWKSTESNIVVLYYKANHPLLFLMKVLMWNYYIIIYCIIVICTRHSTFRKLCIPYYAILNPFIFWQKYIAYKFHLSECTKFITILKDPKCSLITFYAIIIA